MTDVKGGNGREADGSRPEFLRRRAVQAKEVTRAGVFSDIEYDASSLCVCVC